MKFLYLISLIVIQIFFILVVLMYFSQPPDQVLVEHVKSPMILSMNHKYLKSIDKTGKKHKDFLLESEEIVLSKDDISLNKSIFDSEYNIEKDFEDDDTILTSSNTEPFAKSFFDFENTDDLPRMETAVEKSKSSGEPLNYDKPINVINSNFDNETIKMINIDLKVQTTKKSIIDIMANEFASTPELNEMFKRDENFQDNTKIFEDMKSQKINISVGEKIKDSFKLGSVIPSTKARKILIVTHARSGSSFIGEMLTQYPGTFYSFEPLHLDRDKLTLEDKINRIKQVLKCEPSERFINHSQDWPLPLRNNFRYLNACLKSNQESCYLPEVYKSACEMFPIRLIKTIRLPFSGANSLLMDPEIGNKLKVIFLFRDPRGVHQSVKSKVWWSLESDTKEKCEELESDTLAAIALKRQHPDRVYLIRYEDVCLDTLKAAESMRNFLDLSRSEFVDNFIQLHTHGKPWSGGIDPDKNPFSTIRNTTSKAYDWRYNIKDRDILNIQRFCANAMNMLGYHPIENIKENKLNQSYIVMGKKPTGFD